MKIRNFALLLVLTMGCAWIVACGPDRAEKLRNGVSYAEGALQQVGVNPLATATYQSIAGSGGGPAKYVNYMLPKKDPVFDSFEDGKPTHPWTVVIRPTAVANEYSIEGFGDDVNKPLVVKYVTLKVASE
jgi:hypothetical protein